MRRRGVKKEKDNTERWMLSYLDFITLLMIFFLMMYAISNVDNKKAEALAHSLKIGFNSGNGENIIAVSDSSNTPPAIDEETLKALKEAEKLEDIKKKVDELVETSELKGSVTTSIQERGLLISFNDSVLFNSGDAKVKTDWYNKLVSISKVLNEIGNYIRVEGHTDNVAINTEYYHSNWQLSSDRASNVVEFLISQGIKPERLSAVGYGEYRPIKGNDTEEGKAANRRVDILILNNKFNESETQQK
ncbi:OmpA family protein [Clostridium sp. C2-6-12]|uniref:OmpA family protein n=1 Tax=Clostridium sp. C2-6-12 TaxID=2698832 RepID=UPI0019244EA8|nr:OmpA family protein [Clostridium sp. C2-6-12]